MKILEVVQLTESNSSSFSSSTTTYDYILQNELLHAASIGEFEGVISSFNRSKLEQSPPNLLLWIASLNRLDAVLEAGVKVLLSCGALSTSTSLGEETSALSGSGEEIARPLWHILSTPTSHRLLKIIMQNESSSSDLVAKSVSTISDPSRIYLLLKQILVFIASLKYSTEKTVFNSLEYLVLFCHIIEGDIAELALECLFSLSLSYFQSRTSITVYNSENAVLKPIHEVYCNNHIKRYQSNEFNPLSGDSASSDDASPLFSSRYDCMQGNTNNKDGTPRSTNRQKNCRDYSVSSICTNSDSLEIVMSFLSGVVGPQRRIISEKVGGAHIASFFKDYLDVGFVDRKKMLNLVYGDTFELIYDRDDEFYANRRGILTLVERQYLETLSISNITWDSSHSSSSSSSSSSSRSRCGEGSCLLQLSDILSSIDDSYIYKFEILWKLKCLKMQSSNSPENILGRYKFLNLIFKASYAVICNDQSASLESLTEFFGSDIFNLYNSNRNIPFLQRCKSSEDLRLFNQFSHSSVFDEILFCLENFSDTYANQLMSLFINSPASASASAFTVESGTWGIIKDDILATVRDTRLVSSYILSSCFTKILSSDLYEDSDSQFFSKGLFEKVFDYLYNKNSMCLISGGLASNSEDLFDENSRLDYIRYKHGNKYGDALFSLLVVELDFLLTVKQGMVDVVWDDGILESKSSSSRSCNRFIRESAFNNRMRLLEALLMLTFSFFEFDDFSKSLLNEINFIHIAISIVTTGYSSRSEILKSNFLLQIIETFLICIVHYMFVDCSLCKKFISNSSNYKNDVKLSAGELGGEGGGGQVVAYHYIMLIMERLAYECVQISTSGLDVKDDRNYGFFLLSLVSLVSTYVSCTSQIVNSSEILLNERFLVIIKEVIQVSANCSNSMMSQFLRIFKAIFDPIKYRRDIILSYMESGILSTMIHWMETALYCHDDDDFYSLVINVLTNITVLNTKFTNGIGSSASPRGFLKPQLIKHQNVKAILSKVLSIFHSESFSHSENSFTINDEVVSKMGRKIRYMIYSIYKEKASNQKSGNSSEPSTPSSPNYREINVSDILKECIEEEVDRLQVFFDRYNSSIYSYKNNEEKVAYQMKLHLMFHSFSTLLKYIVTKPRRGKGKNQQGYDYEYSDEEEEEEGSDNGDDDDGNDHDGENSCGNSGLYSVDESGQAPSEDWEDCSDEDESDDGQVSEGPNNNRSSRTQSGSQGQMSSAVSETKSKKLIRFNKVFHSHFMKEISDVFSPKLFNLSKGFIGTNNDYIQHSTMFDVSSHLNNLNFVHVRSDVDDINEKFPEAAEINPLNDSDRKKSIYRNVSDLLADMAPIYEQIHFMWVKIIFAICEYSDNIWNQIFEDLDKSMNFVLLQLKSGAVEKSSSSEQKSSSKESLSSSTKEYCVFLSNASKQGTYMSEPIRDDGGDRTGNSKFDDPSYCRNLDKVAAINRELMHFNFYFTAISTSIHFFGRSFKGRFLKFLHFSENQNSEDVSSEKKSDEDNNSPSSNSPSAHTELGSGVASSGGGGDVDYSNTDKPGKKEGRKIDSMGKNFELRKSENFASINLIFGLYFKKYLPIVVNLWKSMKVLKISEAGSESSRTFLEGISNNSVSKRILKSNNDENCKFEYLLAHHNFGKCYSFASSHCSGSKGNEKEDNLAFSDKFSTISGNYNYNVNHIHDNISASLDNGSVRSIKNNMGENITAVCFKLEATLSFLKCSDRINMMNTSTGIFEIIYEVDAFSSNLDATKAYISDKDAFCLQVFDCVGVVKTSSPANGEANQNMYWNFEIATYETLGLLLTISQSLFDDFEKNYSWIEEKFDNSGKNSKCHSIVSYHLDEYDFGALFLLNQACDLSSVSEVSSSSSISSSSSNSDSEINSVSRYLEVIFDTKLRLFSPYFIRNCRITAHKFLNIRHKNGIFRNDSFILETAATCIRFLTTSGSHSIKKVPVVRVQIIEAYVDFVETLCLAIESDFLDCKSSISDKSSSPISFYAEKGKFFVDTAFNLLSNLVGHMMNYFDFSVHFDCRLSIRLLKVCEILFTFLYHFILIANNFLIKSNIAGDVCGSGPILQLFSAFGRSGDIKFSTSNDGIVMELVRAFKSSTSLYVKLLVHIIANITECASGLMIINDHFSNDFPPPLLKSLTDCIDRNNSNISTSHYFLSDIFFHNMLSMFPYLNLNLDNKLLFDLYDCNGDESKTENPETARYAFNSFLLYFLFSLTNLVEKGDTNDNLQRNISALLALAMSSSHDSKVPLSLDALSNNNSFCNGYLFTPADPKAPEAVKASNPEVDVSSPGLFQSFETLASIPKNPQVFDSLLSSPQMRNLLANPRLFQEQILNSSELQQAFAMHPHIREQLSNPNIIQDAINLMKNPEMLREALLNASSDFGLGLSGSGAQGRSVQGIGNVLGDLSPINRNSTMTTSSPKLASTITRGEGKHGKTVGGKKEASSANSPSHRENDDDEDNWEDCDDDDDDDYYEGEDREQKVESNLSNAPSHNEDDKEENWEDCEEEDEEINSNLDESVNVAATSNVPSASLHKPAFTTATSTASAPFPQLFSPLLAPTDTSLSQNVAGVGEFRMKPGPGWTVRVRRGKSLDSEIVAVIMGNEHYLFTSVENDPRWVKLSPKEYERLAKSEHETKFVPFDPNLEGYCSLRSPTPHPNTGEYNLLVPVEDSVDANTLHAPSESKPFSYSVSSNGYFYLAISSMFSSTHTQKKHLNLSKININLAYDPDITRQENALMFALLMGASDFNGKDSVIHLTTLNVQYQDNSLEDICAQLQGGKENFDELYSKSLRKLTTLTYVLNLFHIFTKDQFISLASVPLTNLIQCLDATQENSELKPVTPGNSVFKVSESAGSATSTSTSSASVAAPASLAPPSNLFGNLFGSGLKPVFPAAAEVDISNSNSSGVAGNEVPTQKASHPFKPSSPKIKKVAVKYPSNAAFNVVDNCLYSFKNSDKLQILLNKMLEDNLDGSSANPAKSSIPLSSFSDSNLVRSMIDGVKSNASIQLKSIAMKSDLMKNSVSFSYNDPVKLALLSIKAINAVHLIVLENAKRNIVNGRVLLDLSIRSLTLLRSSLLSYFNDGKNVGGNLGSGFDVVVDWFLNKSWDRLESILNLGLFLKNGGDGGKNEPEVVDENKDWSLNLLGLLVSDTLSLFFKMLPANINSNKESVIANNNSSSLYKYFLLYIRETFSDLSLITVNCSDKSDLKLKLITDKLFGLFCINGNLFFKVLTDFNDSLNHSGEEMYSIQMSIHMLCEFINCIDDKHESKKEKKKTTDSLNSTSTIIQMFNMRKALMINDIKESNACLLSEVNLQDFSSNSAAQRVPVILINDYFKTIVDRLHLDLTLVIRSYSNNSSSIGDSNQNPIDDNADHFRRFISSLGFVSNIIHHFHFEQRDSLLKLLIDYDVISRKQKPTADNVQGFYEKQNAADSLSTNIIVENSLLDIIFRAVVLGEAGSVVGNSEHSPLPSASSPAGKTRLFYNSGNGELFTSVCYLFESLVSDSNNSYDNLTSCTKERSEADSSAPYFDSDLNETLSSNPYNISYSNNIPCREAIVSYYIAKFDSLSQKICHYIDNCWLKKWSSSRNKFFFFKIKSGEIIWDTPTAAAATTSENLIEIDFNDFTDLCIKFIKLLEFKIELLTYSSDEFVVNSTNNSSNYSYEKKFATFSFNKKNTIFSFLSSNFQTKLLKCMEISNNLLNFIGGFSSDESDSFNSPDDICAIYSFLTIAENISKKYSFCIKIFYMKHLIDFDNSMYLSSCPDKKTEEKGGDSLYKIGCCNNSNDKPRCVQLKNYINSNFFKDLMPSLADQEIDRYFDDTVLRDITNSEGYQHLKSNLIKERRDFSNYFIETSLKASRDIKDEVEKGKLTTCDGENHALELSSYKEKTYSDGWNCNFCGVYGFGHRWLCLQCRFDCCNSCYLKSKDSDKINSNAFYKSNITALENKGANSFLFLGGAGFMGSQMDGNVEDETVASFCPTAVDSDDSNSFDENNDNLSDGNELNSDEELEDDNSISYSDVDNSDTNSLFKTKPFQTLHCDDTTFLREDPFRSPKYIAKLAPEIFGYSSHRQNISIKSLRKSFYQPYEDSSQINTQLNELYLNNYITINQEASKVDSLAILLGLSSHKSKSSNGSSNSKRVNRSIPIIANMTLDYYCHLNLLVNQDSLSSQYGVGVLNFNHEGLFRKSNSLWKSNSNKHVRYTNVCKLERLIISTFVRNADLSVFNGVYHQYSSLASSYLKKLADDYTTLKSAFSLCSDMKESVSTKEEDDLNEDDLLAKSVAMSLEFDGAPSTSASGGRSDGGGVRDVLLTTTTSAASVSSTGNSSLRDHQVFYNDIIEVMHQINPRFCMDDSSIIILIDIMMNLFERVVSKAQEMRSSSRKFRPQTTLCMYEVPYDRNFNINTLHKFRSKGKVLVFDKPLPSSTFWSKLRGNSEGLGVSSLSKSASAVMIDDSDIKESFFASFLSGEDKAPSWLKLRPIVVNANDRELGEIEAEEIKFLTEEDIKEAFSQILSGDLINYALKEMNKGIMIFDCSWSHNFKRLRFREDLKHPESLKIQAELVVEPELIAYLTNELFDLAITEKGAIALATGIEYMMVEVLELSCNSLKDRGEKSSIYINSNSGNVKVNFETTLLPADVRVAISADPELKATFSNIDKFISPAPVELTSKTGRVSGGAARTALNSAEVVWHNRLKDKYKSLKAQVAGTKEAVRSSQELETSRTQILLDFVEVIISSYEFIANIMMSNIVSKQSNVLLNNNNLPIYENNDSSDLQEHILFATFETCRSPNEMCIIELFDGVAITVFSLFNETVWGMNKGLDKSDITTSQPLHGDKGSIDMHKNIDHFCNGKTAKEKFLVPEKSKILMESFRNLFVDSLLMLLNCKSVPTSYSDPVNFIVDYVLPYFISGNFLGSFSNFELISEGSRRNQEALNVLIMSAIKKIGIDLTSYKSRLAGISAKILKMSTGDDGTSSVSPSPDMSVVNHFNYQYNLSPISKSFYHLFYIDCSVPRTILTYNSFPLAKIDQKQLAMRFSIMKGIVDCIYEESSEEEIINSKTVGTVAASHSSILQTTLPEVNIGLKATDYESYLGQTTHFGHFILTYLQFNNICNGYCNMAPLHNITFSSEKCQEASKDFRSGSFYKILKIISVLNDLSSISLSLKFQTLIKTSNISSSSAQDSFVSSVLSKVKLLLLSVNFFSFDKDLKLSSFDEKMQENSLSYAIYYIISASSRKKKKTSGGVGMDEYLFLMLLLSIVFIDIELGIFEKLKNIIDNIITYESKRIMGYSKPSSSRMVVNIHKFFRNLMYILLNFVRDELKGTNGDFISEKKVGGGSSSSSNSNSNSSKKSGFNAESRNNLSSNIDSFSDENVDPNSLDFDYANRAANFLLINVRSINGDIAKDDAEHSSFSNGASLLRLKKVFDVIVNLTRYHSSLFGEIHKFKLNNKLGEDVRIFKFSPIFESVFNHECNSLLVNYITSIGSEDNMKKCYKYFDLKQVSKLNESPRATSAPLESSQSILHDDNSFDHLKLYKFIESALEYISFAVGISCFGGDIGSSSNPNKSKSYQEDSTFYSKTIEIFTRFLNQVAAEDIAEGRHEGGSSNCSDDDSSNSSNEPGCMWTCAVCTYAENVSDYSSCIICESRKPARSSKSTAAAQTSSSGSLSMIKRIELDCPDNIEVDTWKQLPREIQLEMLGIDSEEDARKLPKKKENSSAAGGGEAAEKISDDSSTSFKVNGTIMREMRQRFVTCYKSLNEMCLKCTNSNVSFKFDHLLSLFDFMRWHMFDSKSIFANMIQKTIIYEKYLFLHPSQWFIVANITSILNANAENMSEINDDIIAENFDFKQRLFYRFLKILLFLSIKANSRVARMGAGRSSYKVDFSNNSAMRMLPYPETFPPDVFEWDGCSERSNVYSSDYDPEIELEVERKNPIISSYYKLKELPPFDFLLKKIKIEFSDELGIDAGGLLKEFFMIFSREILNSKYGLFTQNESSDEVGGSSVYLPSPDSALQEDYLSYFNILGKFMGLAMREKLLLNSRFPCIFYKLVLQYYSASIADASTASNVPLEELKEWDKPLYKMFTQIIDPSLTLADLYLDDSLTFSIDRKNQSGATITVDLIEDGRNVTVTDANKLQYVQLALNYKLRICFQDQMNAITEGIYSIIPFEILSIFNANEFQALTSINENEDISIDDLQKHTLYGNGYHNHDKTILRFYRVLRTFTNAQKRNFLQFVTGSRHVPLGGFACLKSNNSDHHYTWFKIEKCSGISDQQESQMTATASGGGVSHSSPPTYAHSSSYSAETGNFIDEGELILPSISLTSGSYSANASMTIEQCPALLPTSHTCFNQLDLPPYDSDDIMRDKLLKAIEMGCEGFGFA